MQIPTCKIQPAKSNLQPAICNLRFVPAESVTRYTIAFFATKLLKPLEIVYLTSCEGVS